jgi:hypothetical protein
MHTCNRDALGLPPYGETRCTICGHRQPDSDGFPPVASRMRPIRTWIPELRSRRKAKRRVAE